jgi:hypothetical protein
MPQRIFWDLLAKDLRAPQLPVADGALISAFGSRTKRKTKEALIYVEIDGVINEQVFIIAPVLLPDAVLGINFLKENYVVIDLSEGRFKTRRDSSDCELKFFYVSLPKNKVGVGLTYTKTEISIECFGITKTVGRKRKYCGRSDPTRINAYAAAKSEGVIDP